VKPPLCHYSTTMVAAVLAVVISAPVQAMDDAAFLDMTNQEAGQDSGKASPVAPVAKKTVPAEPRQQASDSEETDIQAARLGITTPVGKQALVQELRNYYPGSYRTFRGLDPQQVKELVELFSNTGELGDVLMRMDTMASN